MRVFKRITIAAMSIVAMMAVGCTNAGGSEQGNSQLETGIVEMNAQFVAFMESVDSLNAAYLVDSTFTGDVVKTPAYELWKRDSVNYYVGTVLDKISDSKDKYIKGSKVDANLLYDDVMKYCAESGLDMSGIDNEGAKAILLPMVDKLCVMLENIKAESDINNVLLNKFLGQVEQTGIVEEGELNAYKDFVVKEIAYCSTLSNELLPRYVDDFNKLVDQSKMSLERKENIRNCMMLVVDRELDR